MKAYSNISLPKEVQSWKEGQFIYYFNHKDNGIQEEGKVGQRYEAEFTIANGINQVSIETALVRSIADPVLERCVVDNIEVEGKQAIGIIKTYTKTSEMTSKIDAIFIASPVNSIEEELIEEEIKPK